MCHIVFQMARGILITNFPHSYETCILNRRDK